MKSRDLIFYSLITISITLLVLTAPKVFSSEFKYLETNKLFFEADKSVSTNRHWAIPEGEAKKGAVNMLVENNFKKVFYSTTYVKSFYTDKQFRYVALDQEFSLRSSIGLELFYKHESEHKLDFSNGTDYYNANSVGLRLILIDKK